MADFQENERSYMLPHYCLVKLQAVYPTLKKAERLAADTLLRDPRLVAENTITELSTLSGSSEATWFRLAKRLGCSGFSALKADIADHLRSLPGVEDTAVQPYEDIDRSDRPLDIAHKVFESSISALSDTISLLDEEQYDKAVQALCAADHIVLCGVGDAYTVVRSAYQKFFRAGLQVYESEDQDLQLIAISRMQPQDVLIAFSYSGRTKTVLELVKYAREHGITVIAITNFPQSPLTKNADIVLLTAAFARHVSGEIVSKRLTQLCLVESLYVNVLMKSDRDLGENLLSANDAIRKNKS